MVELRWKTALLRLSQEKGGGDKDTHDKNPSGGLTLNMMGSLFLVSVYKTPGAKVVDDRDSTS